MALMPLPGKGEKSRIVALVVMLGFALMLAGTLSSRFLTPEGGAGHAVPPDEQAMAVANEAATVLDPLPGLSAHRELNEYHMEVGERSDRPELESDLGHLQMGLQEALSWLKAYSHQEIAERSWPRGRWSFAKVMREPDRWRLQILHVYGVLMDRRIIEYPDAPEGMRKLWCVLLHNYRLQQTYTVITPLVPEAAHPPKGMTRGTNLACDGMFLRRHPYHSKTGWKWTPLVVAKRLVEAHEGAEPRAILDERGDPGTTYEDIRPRQVTGALDEGFLEEKLFAPSKDGKGLRMFGGEFQDEVRDLKTEKAALDHVFQYVWHYRDEDLRAEVNPEVEYVSLMQGTQAPRWMRGKIARFRGRVGTVEPWRFPEDGSGMTRIYLVYAHDALYKDPTFTWVLACLNLPEGLREDDLVETEGAFVKLYPYRTPAGKWHWAPLIVCKAIRYVPPDPSTTYAIIGLGVALLFVLMAMFVASRRDTTRLDRVRQRFQEKRVQRDRARREQQAARRTSGADAGAANAPPPAAGTADPESAPADGSPPAAGEGGSPTAPPAGET